MTHLNATLRDSLSPEQLAELAQSFGLDLEPSDYVAGAFIEDEWLDKRMGYTTGSHLWDRAWRFGIVVDNDVLPQLGDLWRPNGRLTSGYYVPCDYDTDVSVIDIDHPPLVDAAWDARPV